ncbi:MAG: AlkD-like family protein [Fibrobacteres bacterium]|nr:AlkD-like family protein [Fibrobacterota bacterium]
MTAEEIRKKLKALGSPEVEAIAKRFFKTGPGEYGEGDRFRGIKVPIVRGVAAEFRTLPFPEVKRLLSSPFHEDRLAALIILDWQFKRGGDAVRAGIYRLYLGGARWINNWDLVDVSAPNILGAYLEERDRAPLYKLARSKNLWERRMAILATLWYIRKKDFSDALRIADILAASEEDLLHKAVGWMLREVGKRDREAEEIFLARHCRTMPRTMLRYAIEHFPEARRRAYLKGAP